MNQYIKNILNTRGWQEIEKMFREEIEKSKTLDDLPKDSNNEVVAREARVRGETYKSLNELLKRIKLAGTVTEEKKPVKYV